MYTFFKVIHAEAESYFIEIHRCWNSSCESALPRSATIRLSRSWRVALIRLRWIGAANEICCVWGFLQEVGGTGGLRKECLHERQNSNYHEVVGGNTRLLGKVFKVNTAIVKIYSYDEWDDCMYGQNAYRFAARILVVNQRGKSPSSGNRLAIITWQRWFPLPHPRVPTCHSQQDLSFNIYSSSSCGFY